MAENDLGRCDGDGTRFTTGDIVTVKPLTKKMKDRVNSHGFVMRVYKYDGHVIMIDNILYDIHLESLDKTFRVGETKTTWSGWVMVGRDCELAKVLPPPADK